MLNKTDKITVSLFYDEKLDIGKEKIFIDQFVRNCKLYKCSLQVACEIITYISDFNYDDILFDRELICVTCFEFRRPTDETFVHRGVTFDWQKKNEKL